MLGKYLRTDNVTNKGTFARLGAQSGQIHGPRAVCDWRHRVVLKRSARNHTYAGVVLAEVEIGSGYEDRSDAPIVTSNSLGEGDGHVKKPGSRVDDDD